MTEDRLIYRENISLESICEPSQSGILIRPMSRRSPPITIAAFLSAPFRHSIRVMPLAIGTRNLLRLSNCAKRKGDYF